MKTIDYLLHSTMSLDAIQGIIAGGFKPSYSREQFTHINILVPMISFSNVLLRDVGPEEVFHYGDYGLILSRSWALDNEINPVCYTFKDGMLDAALLTILNNTAFLNFLKGYKTLLEKNTLDKGRPISEQLIMTNLSTEVARMLDYLSVQYNEQLFDSIVGHAESTYKANQKIIKLAKPFTVIDKHGHPFVAYNEREWRKVFQNLDYIYEEEPEYDIWVGEDKPHLHNDILTFELKDLLAVVVAKDAEKSEVKNFLIDRYDRVSVDKRMQDGHLFIDTLADLINTGF